MHHGALTSCFPLAYRAPAVVPPPLHWSSTLSLSEPTCRVAARTVHPAPRYMSVGCGGASIADRVPGACATESLATLQGLRLPAKWLANTALARNCRIWFWILGFEFIVASQPVPCESGVFCINQGTHSEGEVDLVQGRRACELPADHVIPSIRYGVASNVLSLTSAVPHCIFAALLGEHVTTLPRLMAAQADPGAVKRMCHALAGTAVERATSGVNGQPGAPSLVGGMHGRRSCYGQYSQGAAQEVAALGEGQQGMGREVAEFVRLCGLMAKLVGGDASLLHVNMYAAGQHALIPHCHGPGADARATSRLSGLGPGWQVPEASERFGAASSFLRLCFNWWSWDVQVGGVGLVLSND